MKAITSKGEKCKSSRLRFSLCVTQKTCVRDHRRHERPISTLVFQTRAAFVLLLYSAHANSDTSKPAAPLFLSLENRRFFLAETKNPPDPGGIFYCHFHMFKVRVFFIYGSVFVQLSQ